MSQNFDANSTNVTELRTNERTNEQTNIQTDERKDENYIPVGINAGGITTMAAILLSAVLKTFGRNERVKNIINEGIKGKLRLFFRLF